MSGCLSIAAPLPGEVSALRGSPVPLTSCLEAAPPSPMRGQPLGWQGGRNACGGRMY